MLDHTSMKMERSAAGVGGWAITLSLAAIFLWFGCLKFTAYEQSGVAGFIMNSPVISWLHGLFGIAGGARVIGVIEILTGLLIAARVVDPRLSLIGGAMATLTFLTTLTFLGTTPGIVQPGYDNPFALSALPGQFLLKDLGLLAASFWIVCWSWDEIQRSRRLLEFRGSPP